MEKTTSYPNTPVNHGLLASLMRLLYPPLCPFCGRALERDDTGMCPACESKLPWTEPDAVKRVPGCDLCLAPLWYQDGVPHGVRSYKFHGGQNHAALFARLMGECVQARLPGGADLVTWVPLSRKRLRQRGYDQARLLAEGMAENLGLPAAALLEKVRHTSQQSRLDNERERLANVSGAYRLLDGARERCQGQRVLLVDDVVTTGATMGECVEVLRAAGAGTVVGVSLAWARRGE